MRADCVAAAQETGFRRLSAAALQFFADCSGRRSGLMLGYAEGDPTDMRRTSDTAVGPAPRIRGRCATARRPAGRLRCRGRRRAPRPIRDTATPVAGGLPADASRSATAASTSGVSAVAGLDRGPGPHQFAKPPAPAHYRLAGGPAVPGCRIGCHPLAPRRAAVVDGRILDEPRAGRRAGALWGTGW